MPKLLGEDIVLRRPASYSLRWEIAVVAASSGVSAKGAAIGLCWAGSEKALGVTLAGCNFSVPTYGQRVNDALLGRREDFTNLMEVGTAALALVQEGLVSEDEVEKAEGF